MINKIDKPLAKVSENRIQKTQINKIIDEKKYHVFNTNEFRDSLGNILKLTFQ
jgi:hypothetical protein